MEAIELLKKQHQREMDELRRSSIRQSRQRELELRELDRTLSRVKRHLTEMAKPKHPPIVWTQLKWVFNVLL